MFRCEWIATDRGKEMKRTEFEGELISSDEGEMHWIDKMDISSLDAVDDLQEMLDVMLNEDLTEFQYVIEEGEWKVILK